MQNILIAIDLGGTKCAGAAITYEGKILHRDKESMIGLSGEEVGKVIHGIILRLKDKVSTSYVISGIGISVPGISHHNTGTVWAPNIPGWEDFPLRAYLRERLDQSISIHVDSDRACSISGETWLGVAQGYKNAIFLAFGTGIGAGILIDGKILRGAQDIAGAIGWMVLDDLYPEDYRRFGCFEYNASGDGLARLARDISARGLKSASEPDSLRSEDLFEAYRAKDPLAEETIHTAVQYWAKAIANLVSIFNPEIIIFGGGVFGPGLGLLDLIYESSKKWAQPVAIEQVRLVGGQLGNDAQLVGAAKLALDAIKTSS